MKCFKSHGFSLVELLVTLTLSSLIISFFLLNLNHFASKSAEIIKTIQAQDNAVSALLLLQHQIEAAGTTECAQASTPPYEILARNDPRITTWDKHPREMVSQNALLVQQLTDTFSLTTREQHIPVKYFVNQPLVLDDCIHSKIINGSELNQALADFQLPVTINFLNTRIYFLGQKHDETGLYLYYHQDRNEIISNISSLDFIAGDGHIRIEVQPEFSHEVYHVQV